MKANEKTTLILDYITSYTNENGLPPTVREIAKRFNIKSTSTVQYYLEKLRNEGAIVSANNKSRHSMPVSTQKSEVNFAKIVGSVSAGKGIFAQENIEGTYPLPTYMFPGDDTFMLKVQGDSMTEAGIDDGDMVIVKKQENAEKGDIVIALWEDTATVKRFVSCADGVMTLHPENSAMEDIILQKSQEPMIVGKVIGCIKKF